MFKSLKSIKISKSQSIYHQNLTKNNRINNKKLNNCKKIRKTLKIIKYKIQSTQSKIFLKCLNKTQSIEFSVMIPNPN